MNRRRRNDSRTLGALWLLLSLSIAAFLLSSPQPARGDISPEQVQGAIDRAVAYLKREQKVNGAWPEMPQYPGGKEALITLALLNSGLTLEDPAVRKAVTYLRNFKATKVYCVALQTMVLCAAEPKKDRLLIQENVKWLEGAQNTSGDKDKKGSWSYNSTSGGSTGDPSNTQFAMLALYEAERVAGAKVQERTWVLAQQYWINLQNPDGSWKYVAGNPASGSMTCAGISSLIIASGELSSGDAKVENGKVRCCGDQQANEAIENGLRWLERNFTVHHNPGSQLDANWKLYYLYGVERVGRMTARRFIGNHDWFREGVDMLIRGQDNLSGYWKGTGPAESDPQVGTALSLLFLSKGRRPILAAKVKHGPSDDWNHHRNDLANLTAFTEKKWERDLTWQVLDPTAASVEDLLQAPVLYFNGRAAPVFSDEQKRRLRDYVDRGGFIFAEACCEGNEFDKGFRKLMVEVFPEPEYKLRLLPPEHPVWRAEEIVDTKFLRPLWGIDVGCRTSVIYCPEDLSCYWELGRMNRRQVLPAAVQEEVTACNNIGVNIMTYATNREVKNRLERNSQIHIDAARDTFDRGKLYVARLQHPGGCNVAPGAIATLMRVAGDKLKLRVEPEARELAITDPQLFSYHMVFMHGRQAFRLTPKERDDLKAYLERGGMLFADAICSSREFTDSFNREMAAMFPDQKLERIPVTDVLFSSKLGGDNLTSVGRRTPQRVVEGPLRSEVKQGEPYLEGLRMGDRWGVIYSPYDISCALESHESLECEGYTRADAARIGINVLLYSFHQ